LRSDAEKRPTGRPAFVCSELAAFPDFEGARRWLERDHAEASE
jgi:hypothetical protein